MARCKHLPCLPDTKRSDLARAQIVPVPDFARKNPPEVEGARRQLRRLTNHHLSSAGPPVIFPSLLQVKVADLGLNALPSDLERVCRALLKRYGWHIVNGGLPCFVRPDCVPRAETAC